MKRTLKSFLMPIITLDGARRFLFIFHFDNIAYSCLVIIFYYYYMTLKTSL